MSIFKNSFLPPPNWVHVDDDKASDCFAEIFYDLFYLKQNLNLYHDKVLLCIGTDRSTGDSLGPLIGTKLTETPQNEFKVYGTLDDPVHATNLSDKLKLIYEENERPCIVAIDACLGRLDSVGKINLNLGSLKPGAGVNKNLPEVGHLHITGIVNIGGFMEYFVLQNTRLSLVMRMANVIARGINKSCLINKISHRDKVASSKTLG